VRLSTGNALALAWLAAVVVACAFAPLLSAHTPSEVIGPPFSPPARGIPLGTDELGRDEWTRLLYGGRVSLVASLSAAMLAIVLGTTAAVVSQAFGRAADTTIMGGSSAAMAIPGLLLALLVVAILGPGMPALILAVGLGLAPGFARLARSALLRLRQESYVGAAAALGASGLDTARVHLLPNASSSLLSLATTHYAWAFAGLTTLTFLGLAGDIARPEWGAMLNAARPYLRTDAWLAFLPGGAMAATILAAHSLGQSLARASRKG
jgi:peptide/nickel transport system permease protein